MSTVTGGTVDALLLINNRDISSSNGATFERRSPLTNEVATRAAAASVADALSAADAAAAALPGWAALGPSPPRALLLKAADALETRASDFVATMTAETGATAAWAGFNISLAAGIMREAASLTTQVSGE